MAKFGRPTNIVRCPFTALNPYIMSETIVKHCLTLENTNATSQGLKLCVFSYVCVYLGNDPYLGQPIPWGGRRSLHMAKDRGSSAPQSSEVMWEPRVSKSYEHNRPLRHIHIKPLCYIFYISAADGCSHIRRGIRRHRLRKYNKRCFVISSRTWGKIL